MAYQLRNEKGVPFRKQGKNVLASSVSGMKILDLSEKNKSFTAVASTEDEDRDKDIVRQDGWKMTNFKKNPVVPWSHNYYSVPVARSVKTWIDKGTKPRLLFTPKFDENDDDSMKIFNKYVNGFLSTFSVGFIGIKMEWRDEENRWMGGREFTQQELLEISCCAVPANPNANVHMGGDHVEESLLTMGYPEVFARTKSGLFYPVVDIALFTQPKEFEVDEGVTAIKAVSIDKDLKLNNPVAYMFDPEQFDDKTANDWIKENVEPEWKVKYFDLKVDKSGGIAVEEVEEESTINLFEKSIETDFVVDDDSNEGKDLEGKNLPLENGKEDVDADKNSVSDVSDDESDADGNTANDPPDTSDNDKDASASENANADSQDQTIVVLNRSIEISKVLKDIDGNVIDRQVITVGTNAKINSIEEFEGLEANKLISLLKAEIEALTQSIDALKGKKDLDIDTQIPDNENVTNADLDGAGNSESKSNDSLIELDDSLLSPANDKTNSNQETIEIDDDYFANSKSDVVDSVKTSISDVLREKLSEIINANSGKID